MKLTDHPDLATAKAYPVDVKRMISNSKMRLYLRGVGLYLIIKNIAKGSLDTWNKEDPNPDNHFLVEHPAKELCELIVDSLAGSSTDDNDFNFIVGDPIGDGVIKDTELLRDALLTEHSAKIQQLLNICKAHCNSVTYPFADATQDDWDKAQLELSPRRVECDYPHGLGYTNRDTKSSVEVVVSEALPYDDIIYFECESAIEGKPYSHNHSKRAAVHIPANSTKPEDASINLSGLKPKVKVFGISKFNRTFSASVFLT